MLFLLIAVACGMLGQDAHQNGGSEKGAGKRWKGEKQQLYTWKLFDLSLLGFKPSKRKSFTIKTRVKEVLADTTSNTRRTLRQSSKLEDSTGVTRSLGVSVFSKETSRRGTT